MIKNMFAILATVLLLSMPSLALSYHSDWELFGKPDNGSLSAYYDKASLIHVGDKILRVTVKYVYSGSGKEEVIQSRKKSELPTTGYERLSHSVVQYEIDCMKRQQAIFMVSEMDIKDRELDHYNPAGRVWTPVSPGGIGDRLLNKVCE